MLNRRDALALLVFVKNFVPVNGWRGFRGASWALPVSESSLNIPVQGNIKRHWEGSDHTYCCWKFHNHPILPDRFFGPEILGYSRARW